MRFLSPRSQLLLALNLHPLLKFIYVALWWVPKTVLDVENVTLGKHETNAIVLFGKRVKVLMNEKYFLPVPPPDLEEGQGDWYASSSGPFRALSPADATHRADWHGVQGPFSGPFRTQQEAEARSKQFLVQFK